MIILASAVLQQAIMSVWKLIPKWCFLVYKKDVLPNPTLLATTSTRIITQPKYKCQPKKIIFAAMGPNTKYAHLPISQLPRIATGIF
jgi:hypothetical protein